LSKAAEYFGVFEKKKIALSLGCKAFKLFRCAFPKPLAALSPNIMHLHKVYILSCKNEEYHYSIDKTHWQVSAQIRNMLQGRGKDNARGQLHDPKVDIKY
jgi:hypothetical protein